MKIVLADEIAKRIAHSGGRCEAVTHHKDCPGVGNVTHHIIRKKDHTPTGRDRNEWEFLRTIWNGPTTLGAGGCHQIAHRNQSRSRDEGMLAPYVPHALTLTPIGWYTSTGQLL